MDAEENPFSESTRLPPHSEEAERGVLGCISLSPQECIPICIEKFKDRSDVFYCLENRAIYELFVEMYDAQKPIDIITAQQMLRDRKHLESIGGVAYLASLPDSVPSAANLGYYIDIVKEKFALRQMIATCTDTVAKAYEFNGEVSELLDKFAHDANKVVQGALSNNGSTGVRSAKQLVPLSIETMERIYLKQESVTGLSTGFPELDKMTLGLHPGEVSIIAARPSTGKSSIAMNIAEHVTVNLNQPVGVFSLEMPAEQLMLRIISCRAKVNLRTVMAGEMQAADFPKLSTAAAQLVKAPLYIDDSRGLSILQAKAKARQMVQQHGIKLFIFDYLQLMHSTNHRAHNREQEVGDVSQGIHDLAGELSVPVILLSQLNREVERHGSRRPRLSDLRETGRAEQDADFVGMLYRTTEQSEDDYWLNKSEAVPVNLLIAKQRNGPTGEIPLVFFRSYTRFESAATQNQKNDDPTENYPEGK